MDTFSADLFVPEPGKLGQLVFDAPDRGVAPRLEFAIEVPFAPFEYGDDEITTALWVSGIQPGAHSWLQLAGTNCSAQTLSELDGSISLFHMVQTVDVSALAFGPIDGNTIDVRLDVEFDVEDDCGEELGLVQLSIDTRLATDGVRVSTALEKRHQSEPKDIAAAIGEAVDLSAYGELTKVPGGVLYALKG